MHVYNIVISLIGSDIVMYNMGTSLSVSNLICSPCKKHNEGDAGRHVQEEKYCRYQEGKSGCKIAGQKKGSLDSKMNVN